VQIREAVKEDATELVTYLHKIGNESDFLTFGPGELSVSVSAEEVILEESRNANNKIMILDLVGNKGNSNLVGKSEHGKWLMK